MNWSKKNSTSSCDTESSSKCSSSWCGAEKRVGQYECLQACSQESRTRGKGSGLCLRMPSTVLDYLLKKSKPPTSPLG